MDFQVLGPLRAFDGDLEVDLGGPKQRLVLAMLLAARGTSVSTDALIEGVWMDSAPATARKTLQGYVHHLRSRISGGLETDKAGYSLDVRETWVDERRFTVAIEDARPLVESDPLRASDELAVALALWRGGPYADLDGAPVLLPEITRLTEARLVALGDRIEADLALGRHDMLIGELESLTVDYSLHERFRGLQMVALYRAGRHGEALRAYTRTRNLFIEELGIEPSNRLKQLEHRILDGDPTLDVPVEKTPGVARAIRGYELREQISTDTSGTVYRGYQRSVGREVAIRVTGAHLANDPQFISRYESDVAKVANLDHPNIVYVQDTWREPGRAYQVMRWVNGERLDSFLANNRPSNWTAMKMIEQIGDALTAAHRAGVVHGDLCARTVLCSPAGDSYVTDFVVGRAAGDEADDRSALARLAFQVLFGVEPTGDARQLLASTVMRPELCSVFELALVGSGCDSIEELVRALRRALDGDVVELADDHDSPLDRTDARCPYKGLQAFQASDAADFFGRDDLVERLLQLVMSRRLVAVVGPSGSGKSSLVKAGLIPRLGEITAPLLIAEMYPGAYPFESLARALRSVAVLDAPMSDQLLAEPRGLSHVLDALLPDDSTQLVLVIDQFEEVFARVGSESVRSLFLDSLVAATTDPGSRLRVLLTLRADFFDRPLRYAEFGGLVEEGLVPVSMPGDADLRAAIEQPAAAVSVHLEPGLVAEMIRDVSDEPGGLPLLQYALTDLFDRRNSDTLMIDEYRTSGGVLGALATRAEALFTDMDPLGQRSMQQAFLRMVTVEEGADHVRRRVTRADLGALEVDRAALDVGLQRFGAHRLLTFDSDPVSRAPTVEVAHESLLREWDRLRRWIEDQRDQLVLRKRLDAAVQEWEESGEDPGYLLRDRRQAQFEGWAADTDMALSSSERAFLQASRQHDEAQVKTASTRRHRVMLALAAAATLAVVFGLFALVQRNQAADQADSAETARLGSEAGFVVERDRQTALLMAVETYRRDPGFEGLNALQRVLVDAGPFLGNVGAGNNYGDTHWLTDDRLLAVTDEQVHLLDVPTGSVTVLPIELGPPTPGVEPTYILASSPAGVAAVAAAEGRVMLVDGIDGTVEPFAPADNSQAIAITDDGSSLAVGRANGTLEIIDRGSGDVTATVLANPPRIADDVPLQPGQVLDAAVTAKLDGVDRLTFDRTGDRIVSSGGVFLRAWKTIDLSPDGPEMVHAWGEDDFNLVATRAETFWIDEIDDDVLVVAGDSFVVRWRMSTGERLSLDTLAADLVDAASAGEGSILLLADDGRVVRRSMGALAGADQSLADVADFEFDTQEQAVHRLSVDAQRTRLAVATDDGVVIAALDGTRLLARSVPIGASERPTLKLDGEMLAAGLVSDGLFDLATQPPTRRSFDVDVEIAQFAGSPASFEFATAGPSDVLIWTSTFMEMRNAYDFDTGDYLGDFWGQYVPAWSDDGRRLARAQRVGGTKVDEPDGDWPGYSTERTMISADFDSTGRRLVLLFADGLPALIVNLESGAEQSLPEMPGGVVSAAFLPGDDEIVVVGGAGAVWVLDARTTERIGEMEDGGVVVVGSVVPPPTVDVEGTLLFSASDGTARLWHLDSGRQIGKPLPTQSGGRPWGVADAEILRVVTPHDANALIWNLNVDEWIDLACAAAGRNMTMAEWATYGPRDTKARTTCPEL